MNTRFAFYLSLAWSILLVACGSHESANAGHDAAIEASTQPASDGASSLLESQLGPDFHCEPTLESIRDGIFNTSCGFGTCHGHVDAAWGLHLTEDVSVVHDELVGKPASSCPNWTLVTPGDVSKSFIWNKLTERKPACGEPMPRGIVPLPQVALDCLNGWISGLPVESAP